MATASNFERGLMRWLSTRLDGIVALAGAGVGAARRRYPALENAPASTMERRCAEYPTAPKWDAGAARRKDPNHSGTTALDAAKQWTKPKSRTCNHRELILPPITI